MEFSKLQTLRVMLEHERINLENLQTNHPLKTADIARAEGNIKALQEQLKQVCGEVNIFNIISSVSDNLRLIQGRTGLIIVTGQMNKKTAQ